jgi:hypothetical protein
MGVGLCKKERRISRKKFSSSTMPGDFKVTVFRINRTGGYKLASAEQLANFMFLHFTLLSL